MRIDPEEDNLLLKAIAHLRPQLESYEETEGGYLCRFQCTETQIRYYFFQFGPDVEILAPEHLRDFFRDRYKEAYAMYAID